MKRLFTFLSMGIAGVFVACSPLAGLRVLNGGHKVRRRQVTFKDFSVVNRVALLMVWSAIAFMPGWLAAAGPARAKTLTVDEATELLRTPNSLRVPATELSPEVAAVLATYKGELRFEALATLSPETAAALATRTRGIDLPKVSALTPATAKALATTQGSLNLPGIKELPTEVAKELAAHTDSLALGVTELSDETAAALAKHPGNLRLQSLKSLTSLVLSERLGQQEWLLIDGVTKITPEIARAICPPSNRVKFKNHVQLYIGLTELPADVAAIIMAGRGHLGMYSLETISDEAAAGLSGPFANIRLFGLKKLSPAAAVSLMKGSGILDIRGFGPEISDETAAAIAKQFESGPNRQIDFNGLKRLTSSALAVALLTKNGGGPHGTLGGVAEVTDEVAQAIAAFPGRINPLPGLSKLTSVPLATKYAAQPGDLRFVKLTAVSNEVAQALATHKGKLDLSGLQSLTDEASKALAKHDGEVVLTGLATLSDAGAAVLRTNEKIKLPASFQNPAK